MNQYLHCLPTRRQPNISSRRIQDYVVTKYIAEFINTLSSLVYGLSIGMATILQLELTPTSCIWLIWLVQRPPKFSNRPPLGVILWFDRGRCLFRRISYDVEIPHSNVYVLACTLRFDSSNLFKSVADELSMHLLTTPLVYRVLTFNTSPQQTKLVGAIILILFTITMVTHMVMDEFILHAITFGLSVVIITVRITQLIPQQFSDPVVRKTLQSTARLGCCKVQL